MTWIPRANKNCFTVQHVIYWVDFLCWFHPSLASSEISNHFEALMPSKICVILWWKRIRTPENPSHLTWSCPVVGTGGLSLIAAGFQVRAEAAGLPQTWAQNSHSITSVSCYRTSKLDRFKGWGNRLYLLIGNTAKNCGHFLQPILYHDSHWRIYTYLFLFI